MEFKSFMYLFVLLVLLLSTLLFAYYRQIGFFGKLKYIIPSVIFSGAVFLMWDLRFSELEIWKYHPEFLSGLSILNLPFEQWLLFLVFPLFSVFIYEYTKIRFDAFEKPNFFLAISLILVVLFGLLAWFSRQKLYPFFTFFLLTIYFGYTIFRNRFKNHLTKFYISYLISVIPFFVLKVILNNLPVVTYNSSQIFNIKIFKVPVEDFGYFFLLFLMNATIYEFLKNRRYY